MRRRNGRHAAASPANPQTAFDRWYREQILEIFGAEPGEPWGERNEWLGAWKP